MANKKPPNQEKLKAHRWKPGESGNPGGRPKKRPISDRYYEIGEEPIPPKLLARINRMYGLKFPKGTVFARVETYQEHMQACGVRPNGAATKAIREIREAIEGKAPQRIEISGPEKTVATISLVFDRKKAKSFEEST